MTNRTHPDTRSSGSGGKARASRSEGPISDASLQRLAESIDAAGLRKLRESHSLAARSKTPVLYRALAERFLASGDGLSAYDVVNDGLEKFGEDLRLRQLLGLALARSGAHERARQVLETLLAEGHSEEETVGILAGSYKRQGLQMQQGPERTRALQRAHELYRSAFLERPNYYTGVNAASLALLLNDSETTRELATQTRDLCEQRLGNLSPDSSERYWVMATLGETNLLLGDLEEAEKWYLAARDAGRRRPADLGATWRQARVLLQHRGATSTRLDSLLEMPVVVSFAGHMIDRPGRSTPRFPATSELEVAHKIQAELARLGAGIGYSSAACGADILFLEAMLQRGGEIHVVLPFAAAEFSRTSVAIIPEGDWAARFDRILARAASVSIVGEASTAADSQGFEYSNRVQDGLAILRARALDAPLAPLAVWDQRLGDGPGGTSAFVASWHGRGIAATIVPVGEPNLVAPPVVTWPSPGGTNMSIKAMLFGDAVNFSRLTETQMPAFVSHYLGCIGALADRSVHRPCFRNTWGDGLFFVFDRMGSAGHFALELSEAIAGVDWQALGLPQMALRLGLHAGPIYEIEDPVVHHGNFVGAHVNRAARIEPITPPGLVYASEQFAALAAAESVSNIGFEYAGQVSLAKEAGVYPMFHVRRLGR
ncbi:MAG: DUF4071 domain-containing protein [Candidatus Wallbacteria bacterium]|nr:DUF4071 domain-containing protein [Candidatus Wallbacteria bacterium]